MFRLRAFRPAALLMGLVAFGCPTARAQTGLSATGAATLAYTDNLLGAPTRPPPGAPHRLAMWYLTLTPGLEFYWDSRQARYLVGYSHGFTRYFRRTAVDAHSDMGVMRGNFLLSPRDDLGLSIMVTRSPAALAGLQQDPATAGQLRPNLATTLFTGTVTQTLRHEYSPNWRGLESASVNVLKPLGVGNLEPWRYTLSGLVGADYTHGHDAWELDLVADYYQSLPATRNGSRVPPTRAVTSGPILRWRRDWSLWWTSELHAGVLTVQRIDPVASGGFFAVFGGSLRWTHEQASAALSYDRNVMPNLFVNQLYYSDTVGLDGRWELTRDLHVALFTGHRLSSNRVVASGGGAGGGQAYGWTSDAGIGWFPEVWPQVALSYQHFQQFGASTGTAALPSSYRNLAMLTVSGRFPSRHEEPIPVAQPARVDGADRDPQVPGLGSGTDSDEPWPPPEPMAPQDGSTVPAEP